MNFKTLKTSETGKKFSAIDQRMEDSRLAIKSLLEDIGATQFRYGYWLINSGISALLFPKGFDIPSYYKKVDGGYLPKLNVKKGKEINAKIKGLPKIEQNELNQCIDFDGAPFKTIGFNRPEHSDYYLFETELDWDCSIPEDCEEITEGEYHKISNNL